MRVRVIGCDGAYPSPGGVCSSYLFTGADDFVVDLGAGSLARLLCHCRPEELAGVFLSHFHADHISDIGVLGHYLRFGPSEPASLALWVPQGGLEWHESFAVRPYGEADAVTLPGGTDLSFFRNGHNPEAHSLRVESEGRSIVYTGDAALSDGLLGFSAGADLVIAEASAGAGRVPGGIRHMGAAEAVLLAAATGASTLLLTHLIPGTDREATLQAAANGFDGRCMIAEEDMLLEV